MDKTNLGKKSPLLDLYIQKQNQDSKFDGMGEEDIAKAIRTLLQTEEDNTEDLN